MSTRTNLSTNIAQSSTTTIVASSNTFTNGGTAVAIVSVQKDLGGAVDPLSGSNLTLANSGTAYTWTRQVALTTSPVADYSCTIVIYTAPITVGQTVNVTATFAGFTPLYKTISVFQYTGQATSPIGVTGSKHLADNGADSITLSGTPSAAGEVIGGMIHTMTVGGSPLSSSPGTNHTELSDVKVDGFCATQIQVQNVGTQSASFSWADLDTLDQGGDFTEGVALEILSDTGTATPGLLSTPILLPAPTVYVPSAVLIGEIGNNTSNASGTTLTITATRNIEVNDSILIGVSADNSGTAGAARTITAADNSAQAGTANTYVTTQVNRTPGAAANDGTTLTVVRSNVTRKILAGDVITLTFSGAVVAKAATGSCWRNAFGPNISSNSATGASTTPSAASTPTAAGQLVIGVVAVEGPVGDTYTQDADTTNGAWIGLTRAGIGTTTSGQTINMAYKIVNAAGVQTYNPTITSRDWAELCQTFAFNVNVPAPRPGTPLQTPISFPAPTIDISTPGTTATAPLLSTPISFPAPTIISSPTATAPLVSTPVTFPAPVVSISRTATPSLLSTPITFPAPAVTVSRTASAPLVSTPITLPAPTIVSSPTAVAPLLSTPITFPAPSITLGITAPAPLVSTPISFPAVTIVSSPTAVAPLLSTPVSFPAPVVTISRTATAPLVSTPISFAAPLITIGQTAVAPLVSTPISLPSPVVVSSPTDSAPLVSTPISFPAPSASGATTGHWTEPFTYADGNLAGNGPWRSASIDFGTGAPEIKVASNQAGTSGTDPGAFNQGYLLVSDLGTLAGIDLSGGEWSVNFDCIGPNVSGEGGFSFRLVDNGGLGYGAFIGNAAHVQLFAPSNPSVAQNLTNWGMPEENDGGNGLWHNIHMTKDATGHMEVYVDGVGNAGVGISYVTDTTVTSTPTLFLVFSRNVNAPTLQTRIDDLQIWDAVVAPPAPSTTAPAPRVSTPITFPAPAVVSSPTATGPLVSTPITFPAAAVSVSRTATAPLVSTPIVMAAVSLVVSPVISAPLVATPITFPAITIISSPTATAPLVATPILLAATTITSAPTAPAGVVLTPIIFPAPTISISRTATGPLVLTPITFPAPSITAGGSATASGPLVSTPISFPPMTVVISVTVVSTLVLTPIVMPAPAVTVSRTATPVVVLTPVTFPSPTIQAGSSATPAAPLIVLPITFPSPSIQAGASATATPPLLSTPVVFPAPVIHISITFVASVIGTPISFPAPSVVVMAFALAPGIVVSVSFPAISIRADQALFVAALLTPILLGTVHIDTGIFTLVQRIKRSGRVVREMSSTTRRASWVTREVPSSSHRASRLVHETTDYTAED